MDGLTTHARTKWSEALHLHGLTTHGWTHYTPRTHYTYMDSLHSTDSLYPYDSLHLCRLSAPARTHNTCADSPHPHESPHLHGFTTLRGLTTPAQAHYTCVDSLHICRLTTPSADSLHLCGLTTPTWTHYTARNHYTCMTHYTCMDSLHCVDSLHMHGPTATCHYRKQQAQSDHNKCTTHTHPVPGPWEQQVLQLLWGKEWVVGKAHVAAVMRAREMERG